MTRLDCFFFRIVPAILFASILFVNVSSVIHFTQAQTREEWRAEVQAVANQSRATDIAMAGLTARLDNVVRMQQEMQTLMNNMVYGILALSVTTVFGLLKDIIMRRDRV